QRIDEDGFMLPIDDGSLAECETLLVFDLEHLDGEEEAMEEEIAAIKNLLKSEDTCVMCAPHHDVGFSENFKQRQMEYRHDRDALVPRQQRFSQYTRSLMKGLGIPVWNEWGLRPAEMKDTKDIAPLYAFRDIDAKGLPKDVTSLSLHPHLPHY